MSIKPGDDVRIGQGRAVWRVWVVRDDYACLSTHDGKSTRNAQPLDTLTVVQSA